MDSELEKQISIDVRIFKQTVENTLNIKVPPHKQFIFTKHLANILKSYSRFDESFTKDLEVSE